MMFYFMMPRMTTTSRDHCGKRMPVLEFGMLSSIGRKCKCVVEKYKANLVVALMWGNLCNVVVKCVKFVQGIRSLGKS